MGINTNANIPIEVQNYYFNGERMIKKIIPQNDFSLLITFDDGKQKRFDMKELLNGQIFKSFKDIVKFKTVYIDDCGCPAWDIDQSVDSNIVWNNKVDISKDSCYIYGKEVPNAETIQAIENVENGRGLSKAFTSVEELMDDLNADD